MGDLYLNIVESKNRDNGGFDRQSVILFADDLQPFLNGFEESLKVLEKSVREKKHSGSAKREGVKREGFTHSGFKSEGFKHEEGHREKFRGHEHRPDGGKRDDKRDDRHGDKRDDKYGDKRGGKRDDKYGDRRGNKREGGKSGDKYGDRHNDKRGGRREGVKRVVIRNKKEI
jgi:hypothetical protein